MRLATITHDGESVAVCGIEEGIAVPVKELVPGLKTVMDVISGGNAALVNLNAAIKVASANQKLTRLPTSQIQWRPPVELPPNIYCVALNNTAADGSLISRPSYPAYFSKPTSALTGAGQPIIMEEHFGLVHNEPELGVIIGRGGRNISEADAMDHVFGYAIVNDVTSAGMRKEDRFLGGYPTLKDGQYQLVEEVLIYTARYKGTDTFCPMGPWAVTKDEVPDPRNLTVKCWLDDDLILDDTTKNLHYSIAQVIFWISAHSTLRAGDIISLGTAVHPDTQRRPLSYGDINKWGDRVRIEIEKLGTLESPVIRNRRADPRKAFPPISGLGADLKKYGLTKAER